MRLTIISLIGECLRPGEILAACEEMRPRSLVLLIKFSFSILLYLSITNDFQKLSDAYHEQLIFPFEFVSADMSFTFRLMLVFPCALVSPLQHASSFINYEQ